MTQLTQRLRRLRTALHTVHPNEAWVRRTRETLLMQASNSVSPRPVQNMQRVRDFVRYLVPRQLVWAVRGPVAAALSIFIVATGSSVASVSAAERSLPGDFLYSLKLATEQARLAFTPDKENKLKLKIEFTTRRGQELKEVVRDRDLPSQSERVVQTTEILKRDLNTVKEQLNDVKSSVSSPKAVEMAKLVDQKTNELVQTLQEAKADVPLDAQGNVTDAQAAAADAGVKAIEVLVEKHQESQDSVGEQEVVQAIQDHTKTVADVTGNSSSTVSVTSNLSPTSTTTVSLNEAVHQMKTVTGEAFAAKKSEDLASSSSTPSLPGVPSNATSSTSPSNGGNNATTSSPVTPP